MGKSLKIPAYQLVLLIVGSRLMQAYTYLPLISGTSYNQDAWISCILSIVYSIIVCFPILFLMNKFRNIEFSEVLNMIMGTIVGKIIAGLIALFFIFLSITWLMVAIIFINSYLFDELPSWIIVVLVGVPIIYIATSGLTTLGRIAAIVVPFAILTVIVFAILGINKMDLHELQPILADSTFMDINGGAFLTAARLSDILIIFVVYHYLTDRKKINKVFGFSLIIFTTLFVVMVISVITVLGVQYARISWNPYYTFTRQVELFEFIQRVESLNALAWFVTTILNMALINFVTSFILQRIFNLKSHKKFVLPLVLLSAVVALLPFLNRTTIVDTIKSTDVYPWVTLLFIFALPFAVLLVYFFRKKSIDKKVKQKEREPNPGIA